MFINNSSNKIGKKQKQIDGNQASNPKTSEPASTLKKPEGLRIDDIDIDISQKLKSTPKKEEEKVTEELPGSPMVQYVDNLGDSSYLKEQGPDDFLPLKKLGAGSFSDVYLVRHKGSGKLFAMKAMSKRKIVGQNLVRYAKTERDVLSYVRHPFIVDLHFAFQTKTKLFLVL